MATKKKVVMKASFNPTDKEKIVKFNTSVVVPAVKNKLEKLNAGTRQMVKVVNGSKIKVTISLDEATSVKVIYVIDGETLMSKSFVTLNGFKTDLEELENNL